MYTNHCNICQRKFTSESSEPEKVCPECKASNEERELQITPKGILVARLSPYGIPISNALEIWDALEAFCIKRAKEDYPNEEYAAIVFDGGGGTVIGVNARHEENYDDD